MRSTATTSLSSCSTLASPPCEDDDPNNRLCVVTELFPFHHQESILVADYGPAFDQAASLVESACAGFTPPPG